jgi:membrane protein DedA with SNARE-associated domain
MAEWIESLIQHLGYWEVCFLMALENLFPPIPSELIMSAAGYNVSRGDLTWWGAVLAGTAGAVVGGLPWYFLGYWIGTERLSAWCDRHGKWLRLHASDIRKADAWFDRHNRAAVFFGRLVPGLRTLISVPAGFSEMPLLQFLLYTTLGSAIWNSALIAAGWWLGENYAVFTPYMDWIALGVVAVIFLAGCWWVFRRRGSEEPVEEVKEA